MNVMITGHRPERLKGREKEVKEWINHQLDILQPTLAINGMAQGVDQIFAKIAKDKGVPLLNVYPHRRKFHPYEEMLNENENVVFFSDTYSKSNYILRDRYMVDNADIVLAVFDGIPAGGTWQTIEYAKQKNKKIIYFNW